MFEGTAGGTYYLHVSSNKDGVCAPYTAAINGLWCTDNYEDNDTFATAAALPSTATTATISGLDEDFYVINSPSTNGSCSVSYTVAAGSTQQLSIEVDDIGDHYIDNMDTSRSTTSQTLTVSWTSTDSPYSLHVTASAQECTTYTITCN